MVWSVRVCVLRLGLLSLVFAALTGAPAQSASKEKIDARVEKALLRFYEEVRVGQALARRAAGVLVFPSIKKGGVVFGGEYGEGALIVDGQTAGYYSSAAISFGIQVGFQARTQIILFMTEDALAAFRNSDGWTVGVDGSVAVLNAGAGTEIDGTSLQKPVIGFVRTKGGLMLNASLEGTKISPIQR